MSGRYQEILVWSIESIDWRILLKLKVKEQEYAVSFEGTCTCNNKLHLQCSILTIVNFSTITISSFPSLNTDDPDYISSLLVFSKHKYTWKRQACFVTNCHTVCVRVKGIGVHYLNTKAQYITVCKEANLAVLSICTCWKQVHYSPTSIIRTSILWTPRLAEQVVLPCTNSYIHDDEY